jgi:hypothetical protein
MTSKCYIRALKRENIKLNQENIKLIKKNKELNIDNHYLAKFLNLITDLTGDTRPLRRHLKIFH